MNKKTNWPSVVRAIGMIITALAFAISWVSIFVEVPQIKDWRFGVLFSFIFFAIFAAWHFNTLQNEISSLKREIQEIQTPSQLNIFVGRSPMKGWIREDDVDIQTAYLAVISHEKRKIVEFHASRLELLQRTADMKPDIRGATFGSGVNNFRFMWGDGEIFTELIPGEKKELLITEFDSGVGYPVFGQPMLNAPEGKKPSIYEIYIQFIGKLEGENDFSYYNYRTEIYCHPEYQILNFAEKSPDIPEELKSKVLFSNHKT
jgi:hypothetical protein